jgi:hypothetical protein|tara:strand:+ start:493 stop:672 length:180 start_codon:yes stop_codon:yes gene_type:complete
MPMFDELNRFIDLMLSDSDKMRVKELNSMRNEDNKNEVDGEIFIIYNKANMKGVVYDNN